jgi:ABC-type transport system substrate-binding protein
MTKLSLTGFCLAILTLAGCAQATTDPAKAASEKAGTVRTQSPSPSPNPSSGGGGGDGGGAGY